MLVAAPSAMAAEVQADLHLDTPTHLYRRGVGFEDSALEANLAKLRAGGTTLAVEVLWPNTANEGPVTVARLLDKIEAEDARLESLQLVRTPTEARTAADSGKIGFVLALEGAHGLGGPITLSGLHARGLALLGLTWSFSNPYAGSSGDDGGGLTDAGRMLVAEAQRLGVLVDVSHASTRTTLDVCAITRAPLVASHSDAAAVRPHARNLKDDEIACIAASGGVIGVNLHRTFLGEPANAARVADHLDHFRRVGGAGVVALGSDYDGMIKTPDGLPDAASWGAIWLELRARGWTDVEIKGLRGENFLRAWDGALGVAGTSLP